MALVPEEQNFERHLGVLDRMKRGEVMRVDNQKCAADEIGVALRNTRAFLAMVSVDLRSPYREEATKLLETSGLLNHYSAKGL